MTTPNDMKRAHLDYCTKLLTKYLLMKGFSEIIKKKEDLHKERLQKIIPDDIPLYKKFYNTQTSLQEIQISLQDKHRTPPTSES